MKKNTRLLLLALAGDALLQAGLPLSTVLQLPVGETQAGKRSLIYYLKREKQIWLERHQGKLTVGITAQGNRLLEAQFQALRATDAADSPAWQLLVLKEAPAGDPHFRSLSALAKKLRILRVTRGVYANPGKFPTALENHLTTLYDEQHLVRATVKEWVFGLDRPVIVSYYDIENLSDIYSSISKEVRRLLDSNYTIKGNVYSTIFIICSVISRLEAALSNDYGLVQQYFPETPSARTLVNQLGFILKTLPQPE